MLLRHRSLTTLPTVNGSRTRPKTRNTHPSLSTSSAAMHVGRYVNAKQRCVARLTRVHMRKFSKGCGLQRGTTECTDRRAFRATRQEPFGTSRDIQSYLPPSNSTYVSMQTICNRLHVIQPCTRQPATRIPLSAGDRAAHTS